MGLACASQRAWRLDFSMAEELLMLVRLFVRLFRIAPRCPVCGCKMLFTHDRYWYCALRWEELSDGQ